MKYCRNIVTPIGGEGEEGEGAAEERKEANVVTYRWLFATGELLDVLFDDWLSDCPAEFKLAHVLNVLRSTDHK